MIVLDTGVVVRALLGLSLPAAVEHAMAAGSVAPDVVVFETIAVFRRMDGRGALPSSRLARALDDLGRFPLLLEPALGLRHAAWKLRHNITARDALFVVLADALRAPLATTDSRLAVSAARHAGIDVIHLPA